MDSETDGLAPQAGAAAASTQMREAREAAGLSLADVAARTRVPLRHLEALERGDYAALPGITYCAGFARAYARAVGLDEKALVAKVREEVDQTGDFTEQYQMYEPADPARVPPRWLAWVAVLIAIVLAGGYGLWRMQLNAPPAEDAPAVEQAETPKAGARPVAPVAPPTGPVVLTAVDDVWLRIYDADGKSILQKMMKKGESFTVPEDANNPMILTGRADALAVTVGGRAVPPLGTAERTISDVPISAHALLARGADGGNETGNGAVAPPAPAITPAAQAPAQIAPTPRPAAPRATAPSSARPASQSVSRPASVARPAASTAPAPVTHAPPGVAAPSAAPAPAASEPAAQ